VERREHEYEKREGDHRSELIEASEPCNNHHENDEHANEPDYMAAHEGDEVAVEPVGV